MKRKIAFILALTMLLAGLSACGNKKDGAADSSDAVSSSAASSEAAGSQTDAAASGSGSAAAGSQQNEVTDPASSADAGQAQQTPAQTPAQDTQTGSQPSKPASGSGAGTSGSHSKPQQSKPETTTPPAEQSKAPAVSDVAAAVESAMAPQAELMSLSAGDLSSLYGLDSSSAEGFVGKMPMMNVQATEFLVVKAVSGKAETVKSGMLKRQADLDATWKQYLPEQYEYVKNYKLVVNGDYVLFAVGENAQAAVNAFNNLTK